MESTTKGKLSFYSAGVPVKHEIVWDGKSELTEFPERDYKVMTEENGWDLIYVPTSPLTTPWYDVMPFANPDPDQHVRTKLTTVRKGPRKRAARVLHENSEWLMISQQGSRR